MSWLGELVQALVFTAILLGAFLLWVFLHDSKTPHARVDYSHVDRRNNLRDEPSDSIAVEVIQIWARLETWYPDDTLGSLSQETNIPFRTLDFARRVRNEVAHRGEYVPYDRLLGAVRILRRAERQIDY